MMHKIAQHKKVSEQMSLFCFNSTAINTSRPIYHGAAPFDNKSHSQASCPW